MFLFLGVGWRAMDLRSAEMDCLAVEEERLNMGSWLSTLPSSISVSHDQKPVNMY